MSNKRSIALITSCILIALVLISIGCTSDTSNISDVDDEGVSNIVKKTLDETINESSPQNLSDSEE